MFCVFFTDHVLSFPSDVLGICVFRARVRKEEKLREQELRLREKKERLKERLQANGYGRKSSLRMRKLHCFSTQFSQSCFMSCCWISIPFSLCVYFLSASMELFLKLDVFTEYSMSPFSSPGDYIKVNTENCFWE